jgi:dephospho-CoA kinase
MIIIGITGTMGAGKGTLVNFLAKEMGFLHYSVRALVTEHILKRGMEVNRDSMVIVANDLRKNHSPSYLVEVLYDRALRSGRNCIIESIRTPGEVEALRKKGNFHLFAIDAKPELRYKRIQRRGSETDHVSFEVFMENEAREMQSDDPNKQNLRKCIDLADHVFTNNRTISHLYEDLIHYMDRIVPPAKH